MALQASIYKKVFHFNFDARTSRGRMKDKTSWFIKLFDDRNPQVFGLGECSPLPGLSPEAVPDLEALLDEIGKKINNRTHVVLDDVRHLVPTGFPSVTFALESAILDLQNGGRRMLYDNSFIRGVPIPINGLVWMGDLDYMLQQASIKISEGYRCIKIKVGGLNFEKECDILHYIRKKYFRENILLRLDANGSFKPDEALYKLNELAKFNIHSIEQPIKPGSEEVEELCRKSPIPIALDEELIGAAQTKEKVLKRIKPQFIILKPTLHGGLQSCAEWISLAEAAGIGWWITSALESNIGLNAIAQFTANYPVQLHQGLGTGRLYNDNFPSPLVAGNGQLKFDVSGQWELSSLEQND
ncbi:MAG: o-succinylbenzoate synthase [Flammeovirgaceae bacterium]|nr:MAG: o-succinylbenzoate synthase [Flammeovirgaceae bacterium]